MTIAASFCLFAPHLARTGKEASMQGQPVVIDEILERHPGHPGSLISLMQDVQEAFGYLSPEALELICEHVGVPLSQAYAVATFYKSFSLKPKGEHEIKVCLGTACHLRGSSRLVSELERRLKIKAGETTSDLRFTLETVNCLGACAMAPVVVVDEEYHHNVTTKQLGGLIKQAAGGEGEALPETTTRRTEGPSKQVAA